MDLGNDIGGSLAFVEQYLAWGVSRELNVCSSRLWLLLRWDDEINHDMYQMSPE